MDTKDNDQGGSDEMVFKMRDPKTNKDELIKILAEILVDGFFELEEQKHNMNTETEV